MSNYKGFTNVELTRPKRSTFNMSHEKRVSTRMGKLTPILCIETLPNDTFIVSSEVLIKLAPMIVPIFQRLQMYVHFFFVPNRLLWEDWEDFITGGRLGETVTAPPVAPWIGVGEMLVLGEDLLDTGGVPDYLGLPPIPDADAVAWAQVRLHMLPMGAWYKVYYDWYRDRNFQADNDYLPMASGQTPAAEARIMMIERYRAWQKDYFTSALISTQRGAEVLLPMSIQMDQVYSNVDDTPADADTYLGILPGDAGQLAFGTAFSPGAGTESARMEGANTEITINTFRNAVALQEWLERNNLAGSRYTESILAHFGRRSSDSRLQRAEYLGGGRAVVRVNEVLTTAYSQDAGAETVPPANPTGTGGAYTESNRFVYNCEEHGFVIGILSCLPTTGYMQGWPRMFFARNTFLDYPWPKFANLGEQEVYEAELWAEPGTGAGDTMPTGAFDASTWPVFGYQSRYSDWKDIYSSAAGDFRNTLEQWHLVRKFAAVPTLDNSFTTYDDANQDRVFNVTGVDTLWLYIYNSVKVKRSLPYFGTPAGLANPN